MLETDLILLRAPEPEDLEALYRWENDAYLWHIGSTTAPYSRHILEQYVREAEHDPYRTGQVRFIIERHADRQAIGAIDLFDFDPLHRRAGIGILIDEAYRGQGYASQALKLMGDYTFSFLKLHQLYAHIPCGNEASIRLFEKNGFVQTGCLKDWLSVPRGGYEDVWVYQKIVHCYEKR